ncbi:MAG: WYL domain-containing protein [Actinomycetota bacterium]|nr:WYL domain-containing protein [Actinomycetota bacterium]
MNRTNRLHPRATTAALPAPDPTTRVQVVAPADPGGFPAVPVVIQAALAHEHVLALDYEDRHGQRSRRQVEPVAFVEIADRWYLLAWCRLREEARCFRLDRITRVLDTGVPVPPCQVEGLLPAVPAMAAHPAPA